MSLVAAYIVPHPPLAVPEVGRGEELKIADTLAGYREVSRRVAAHEPETILVVSPHSAYFGDWIYLGAGEGACGSFEQFGTPQVRASLVYDGEFRDALAACGEGEGLSVGCVSARAKKLDHGIMVPLYYLEECYPSDRYRAVSIGGSGVPREELLAFGRCMARTAHGLGRRTVLLVSGDLSHKLKADGPYGFDPAGPRFDEAFARVVESGDPAGFADLDPALCEDAAECGLSGFIMLAGALAEARSQDGVKFTSELLSLEGPFGVGYGVAAFERREPALSKADPLVALARATIEQYVRTRTVPVALTLPGDLPNRAGCFVSIHTASTGELRGCIGTIDPVRATLADEVIENAVSASTRDPRFPAITVPELDDLEISVDVLFPPESATVGDLDPKRYGVIVSQGFKRGLLLPDLEGVDTVREQLHIACMKAGIDPRAGFDAIDIERFEVVRHA
ncbi:AmmeMemoRadiSam system protein A [Raoultibacter phocaeensis]|uniref:AmmeMemoRadiSam system protein A n=1 Tax=Raoultibacter phocaeensis TaxID=2479841 RepID=UPI00111A1C9D|nr:AmmeMemoRadiSam system protein A [Raoultibacter phocaeensis]